MASRIFRVDVSKSARDFQHVATEPGLGMLDESGANFAILRQWIGDYAAEPFWEQPDLVSFHLRRDGSRLERFTLASVTPADLQKGLNEEFEDLQAKLRKARPETSGEQSLHRVATKTIRDIAQDPEANDFECFLFKYRTEGEPWRLVWCWGFQRLDQQPSKSHICGDEDCHQLFVQRTGTKAICPGCATVSRRAGAGVVGGGGAFSAGRLLTAGLIGVLLLALLLLLGQPKLVVTPESWSGSAGSEVTFEVEQRRYFFFKSDVTEGTLALSHDRRILEFASGTKAKARGAGKTLVTFRYGDRVKDVIVDVAAAGPATSLAIVPEAIHLGLGTTVKLKAVGASEAGEEVDVTDQVDWEVADKEFAALHDGYVEGVKVGKTVLRAKLQKDAFAEPLTAEVELSVDAIEFTAMRVDASPAALRRLQKAEVETTVVDEDGKEYSVVGSSKLNLDVSPENLGDVDLATFIARESGSGELKASFNQLSAKAAISVSGLPSGEFEVSPREINLALYEYFHLDVICDDLTKIEATSSNPAVAIPLHNEHIVANGIGSTDITFTYNGKSHTVRVNVGTTEYADIWIDPDRIVLKPGQRRLVKVVGRTSDGRSIELAPQSLTWEAQPLSEYASFDRGTLYLSAHAPTPRAQRLVARVGEFLVADALVEVVGTGGVGLVVADNNEFMTYPPIPLLDLNVGSYVGRGLVFRGSHPVIGEGLASDHILIKSGLAPGTVITGVNDTVFDGWSPDRIRQHFLEHPITQEDQLVVRRLDGT
ncbi:MAG: hypothetical protein QF805_14720, partial [Pirellulaceae bacterium]|nr:hypothetical protein [Pirellulaceae bacterium]